jgi:hypothetical protein
MKFPDVFGGTLVSLNDYIPEADSYRLRVCFFVGLLSIVGDRVCVFGRESSLEGQPTSESVMDVCFPGVCPKGELGNNRETYYAGKKNTPRAESHGPLPSAEDSDSGSTIIQTITPLTILSQARIRLGEETNLN